MQAFDSQPGWKVVIQATNGKPFMVEGFDALNVSKLSANVILRKRWLKLRNDQGSFEMLNHGSLTTSEGPHPLFSGVREWKTAGLAEKPEVKQDGQTVTISSSMLNGTFSECGRQMGREGPDSSSKVSWQMPCGCFLRFLPQTKRGQVPCFGDLGNHTSFHNHLSNVWMNGKNRRELREDGPR
jgi:hypothetical protein